ncbi:hypothetical protein GCM10008940_31080 [Microbulbifer agarilyticus]
MIDDVLVDGRKIFGGYLVEGQHAGVLTRVLITALDFRAYLSHGGKTSGFVFSGKGA